MLHEVAATGDEARVAARARARGSAATPRYGRLLVALLGLTAACNSPCGAASLQAALDEARPGEVVSLSSTCQVEGAFVVPEGVTLRGEPGTTVSAAGPDDVVVELRDGAALEVVAIGGGGRAGVVTRGEAALRDVDVDARRGVGLYLEDGEVRLERVSVTGPITEENAREPRWIDVVGSPAEAESPGCDADCECERGEVDDAGGRLCASGRWATWTSTIGLLARGATLDLEDVTIAGVAEIGVLAEASDVRWSGGGVADVVGVGVLLRGGRSSLSDVGVRRAVSGLRGVPSYGLIATDGHAIEGEGLVIEDGERFGALLLGASGQLTDLQARGNGDVALWVGGATDVSVTGASAIEGNGFAGVVVSESQGVRLDGLAVHMTERVRRSVGVFGVKEMGDGIQLTGEGRNNVLANLEIRGNARVGILADLAAGASFEGVAVFAAGDALGAVAGEGDAATGAITVTNPAGWDTGIVRGGEAAPNDAAAGGALDAIVTPGPPEAGQLGEIIGPMY